ncbi:lamin tail domain-containing protein [Chitinophagaceae bacterium LB-8]|uniref:Lamin tail domain-containing protein n=1 Tax=Paraflavisolibacter caeni TaxID=2982496 RepID=A0A9X2XPH4_9BACT|nr:lamin tail domain-containing protein [Paraflavisolibacter caeni]MCU7551338.1 lamin tail domain-containing protein [Paraflavisolibacter caeni]
MKPKLLLTLAAIYLLHFSVCAQFTEYFNDIDLTANPPWTSTANSWIVNNNLQLQSNNTIANSSFYISTPSSLATSAQWELSVTLNFNTSSANYVDIYLTASDSILISNKTTGYFVRIGNTDDEICLYRKDSLGTIKKIIDGVNGITNTTSSKLKIKVIRNARNEFELYREDANSAGYTNEGKVADSTYSTSKYFGILVRQSTSSFFQKHFFDDIIVQAYAPDVTPPELKSVTVASVNSLDILFSEALDTNSARSAANYEVTDIGKPASIEVDNTNPALVHLVFNKDFSNALMHTLNVSNIKDVAGNAMDKATATFSYDQPSNFSVIIDEIMSDPSPTVALPNAEYIELKNSSGHDIDLKGWKLTTTSSASGLFPAYILPADSFVIITSNTNALAMATYGNVLGVGSFPALSNEGTTLSLLSNEGTTIHAVSYLPGWYGNEIKSNGGWSLEMIDTHYPCSGQNNWKASTHLSGGTPGRKNAVDAVNKDDVAPSVLNAFLKDSVTIVLRFDEPVDSSGATALSHYSLTPAVTIEDVSITSPDRTQVQLQLLAPLVTKTVYALSVSGITDCAGNEINKQTKLSIGRPETPATQDLVINEILFNPRPGEYDYVEFYNCSNKVIDASGLYIANRKDTGAVNSLKKLSDLPHYIFPGDYIVITEDALSLQKGYLVKNAEAVLVLSTLPSFPDDKGNVVLLNGEGDVIDEVAYSKDWHFGLIVNDDGIALERIDPLAESQNKDNWHSAASTAGYGTPTYKNSQYKLADQIDAAIEVLPKVFSPDNDGYEDMATISYQLSGTGYVANILIFDASGRLVRSLVKNGLLGLKGSWKWDGLDEKKQRLPIGPYIIYTELFNLQGRKQQYKNVVVLARKLK